MGAGTYFIGKVEAEKMKFLLWCILLVLCWPLAILALVLYPIVWLILLPFRLVGIAVEGVLELVWALITLPARLLRAV
jgi:hypothetical protein